MKVLIVSFDKGLSESLRKALEDHDVYTAKNSEEAMKMVPPDMEAVIYDAISGAISEEDINTLYRKKFGNARYLILYDELFPINEDNIRVPQKLLVPRNTDPKEIARKLVEFKPDDVREEKPEQEAPEMPEDFEIEPTSIELESMPTIEELTEQVTGDIPHGEEPQQSREVEKPSPETHRGDEKILIVSFDQALIDTLKGIIGQDYDVVNVKTVKQGIEQARDAKLVVFDAISGVIAEKGLMEMAGDPEISKKPFIILVDDLFPINVDGIPLEDKVAVSRDTDPERLGEILREKLETTPSLPQIEEQPQREEGIEEVMEKITPLPEEFEIEPVPQEGITEEATEEAAPEEEIPGLEALERIIEESGIEEETVPEEQAAQEPPQPAPAVETGRIDIESLVEDALSRALSEERIKEALLSVLRESMGDVKGIISEVVKQEVEKAFEEVDIKDLIRQVTYRALRERLEELIS